MEESGKDGTKHAFSIQKLSAIAMVGRHMNWSAQSNASEIDVIDGFPTVNSVEEMAKVCIVTIVWADSTNIRRNTFARTALFVDTKSCALLTLYTIPTTNTF